MNIENRDGGDSSSADVEDRVRLPPHRKWPRSDRVSLTRRSSRDQVEAVMLTDGALERSAFGLFWHLWWTHTHTHTHRGPFCSSSFFFARTRGARLRVSLSIRTRAPCFFCFFFSKATVAGPLDPIKLSCRPCTSKYANEAYANRHVCALSVPSFSFDRPVRLDLVFFYFLSLQPALWRCPVFYA